MKILQVNYTMNVGGIEAFLMNVYRHIDREKYSFIFLTCNEEYFDYEDEIKALGGKIVRVTHPSKISVFRHIKEVYTVIKKEKIDAVHSHTYFNSAYIMLAAFLAKVKVRITHSHTTYGFKHPNFSKRCKWSISRILINLFATKKLACSKEAGRALFGNERLTLLSNGIDFEQYQFVEQERVQYRMEWGIDSDTLLIGHVGRLDTPKNHVFLFSVLEALLEERKTCKLVLVGTGPLEEELKKVVKEKHLEDFVLFLGNRNDVSHLLNAFDVFVFPSLYEGLPVSLVEVQANGLHALVSDTVSHEIALTDCIEFFSLKASASAWAKKVLEISTQRKDTKEVLSKTTYSIETTISDLNRLYNVK